MVWHPAHSDAARSRRSCVPEPQGRGPAEVATNRFSRVSPFLTRFLHSKIANFIYHKKRVDANAFLSFYVASFRFRTMNRYFHFRQRLTSLLLPEARERLER